MSVWFLDVGFWLLSIGIEVSISYESEPRQNE
jgi:hypothetical protein